MAMCTPPAITDTIQHVPSNHVAVLRKGSYYIFNLVGRRGVYLSPKDIERYEEALVGCWHDTAYIS